MKRFLLTLHKQNFSPSGKDKLLLKDVRDEFFLVKLMYKGLDPLTAFELPYRLVWNPAVPPKIVFFFSHGKLLGVKCLRWINLNVVEGLLQTGALCVRRMRRL